MRSVRLPSTRALLSLSVLLCFLPVTWASFDPNALPGTYQLVHGLTICPDIISFSQPGLLHPPNTVSFDGSPVSGGSLSLITNPPTGGSGFVRHFAVNSQLVGDYYGGILSSRIEWDTSALGLDSYFVFFRPETRFRITWEDVIGPGQPLQQVSAVPVYWFERDVDYIIINNRCLLRRMLARSGTVSRSNCFPSTAVVQTRGGPKTVDRLGLAEEVWTGTQFSPVFAWTHHDPNVRGMLYTSISLADGKRLVVTEGHYVYVHGAPVPAAQVKVGDQMTAGDHQVDVVAVSHGVYGKGLYNPQTIHGDIVVDGILVTTYTTAVPYFTAHALLAPIRMFFNVRHSVRSPPNGVS